MVQHVVPVRPVVAEAHALQPERVVVGQRVQPFPRRLFLVLPVVYLVQPLQADLGILERLRKADGLADGCRQLPDDVAHGHHHAQRDLTLHHRPRRQVGDEQARGLAEEERPRLLRLPQCGAPDAYPEKLHLYALPQPPLLPLAVVQLDFLHARHHLHHVALVGGRLSEARVVQPPPVTHEEHNPEYIKRVPREEHAQDGQVIPGQYAGEHDEVEEGEERGKRVSGHEGLYAAVVPHALQDVPDVLRVEEVQGQPHQLHQEVGNQGDADARVHVQGNPALQEPHPRLRHGQHQLRHQYQPYQVQVVVADALVHHRLCQEGQYQREHASQQHARHQLQ